jgi:hypothetical protein
VHCAASSGVPDDEALVRLRLSRGIDSTIKGTKLQCKWHYVQEEYKSAVTIEQCSDRRPADAGAFQWREQLYYGRG